MVLRGTRVVLRPGIPDDVPRLTAILREPAVACRWGTFSESDVAQQLVGDQRVLVIDLVGEVIGAIQFEEEDDPVYRHAGIAIFLTTSRHRQGLGSEAVRTLARHLIDERGHHRLTIDPSADNEAAIRVYRSVGFRRSASCVSTSVAPAGRGTTGC